MRIFSDQHRDNIRIASQKRWSGVRGEVERKKISAAKKTLNLDVTQISSLYASGRTIKEIGETLNLIPQTVHKFMKSAGIERRSQATRTPRKGTDHHHWKGDGAGYAAFHTRLHRAKGMPLSCGVCSESDPSKMYDWANLTGNYENIDDYMRMCRSCHRLYDRTRVRGGLAVSDNEPQSNASGYKGVSYQPGSDTPWVARISVSKRRITIGKFQSAEDAHCAYVSAGGHVGVRRSDRYTNHPAALMALNLLKSGSNDYKGLLDFKSGSVRKFIPAGVVAE